MYFFVSFNLFFYICSGYKFFYMRKLSNLTRKAQLAVLTAAFSLASATGFAQSGDNLGQEVIEAATDGLTGLLDSVVTLLQVVMGLGAIVVLAIVVFKILKGDREAAEKLAWWIAGLTLGFVLLTVVSNLIPGA